MIALKPKNYFGKAVYTGAALFIALYMGFRLTMLAMDVWLVPLLETYRRECAGLLIFALVEAVLIIALLIRQQTHVETRLRESEENMKLAAEAAGLGLWDWNIEDNQIWATEECRVLYGVPAGSALTYQTFLSIVHPDDRTATHEAIQRALADRSDYRWEYRVNRPDGTQRWITGMGRAFYDAAGQPVRLRGISIDATARKQAEQELARQHQTLAHMARVATLGELSSMLAHELNQPLTAILGNAQAARRFLAHTPPDLSEVQAILDDIVEDDRRAGEVVHRLRGLCRKEEAIRQTLDINALILGVARILRSDLIAKHVSLVLDLGTDLPKVAGDPVQLQQVMLNLMMNGMDAMLTAGVCNHRLEVSTRWYGADSLEIAVRDGGIGIPPDRLEAVFEPFVTSKPDGLGMGLAIGRSIIAAHGGRLWAANHPDRGAVFHFTLPISTEDYS